MLELFEKDIISIKEKLGHKNVGIIFFAIVCLICLFFMNILKGYKIQKQEVQDGYNRAMYDFVSSINNIENEMLKLRISGNDTYTLTTLSSIFAKSNSAKANLDILPFSQDSISNVSKFLNQLSDFSYNLMRDILNGDNVANYKENIDTLYSKISELSNVSDEIYHDLNGNNIEWDELRRVGDEKIKESNAEQEVASVNYIGKTFTEYEGIIYDGAFSNHILTIKPSFISDNIISQDEVEKKLKLQLNAREIEYIGEQDARLPLYLFSIKLMNEDMNKTLYVTKQDGKVYQMISDRRVNEENISIDEAKNRAEDFMSKLGIDSVEPTYFLKLDNMVTISYASVQDDIIIYSDLIKVKVALDNGEIMTYEANGFIYNHKERVVEPQKTVEEARSVLYEDLTIEKERLCIIPTDSKDEVLTYEFLGSIDNSKFLVYVNADNLVVEKIYILLETEGGTLAM